MVVCYNVDIDSYVLSYGLLCLVMLDYGWLLVVIGGYSRL